MAVNVVRYRERGEVRWGLLRGERVVPLADRSPTTREFLAAGREEACRVAASASGSGPAFCELDVLAPITQNQQLVCQGINYRSHMLESGIDPDRQPHNVVFRKASSCIVAAAADVVRPSHVRLLDYEIELGVVVGREITGPVVVTQENLADFVSALVIIDDISARDVQLPQHQFYKGKSYRTFGPIGPFLTLVDAADLARLDDLHLQLSVNGEARQDAFARDLVFKPAATITELSGVHDFVPGDVIATGTPGGCAAQAPKGLARVIAGLLPESVKWRAFIRVGAKNPSYLKPGDVIEASIHTDDRAIDLGEQRNLIVAA